MMNHRAEPISANIPPALKERAEREAVERAVALATVDPAYSSQPVSDRERALMVLAVRSLTSPGLVEMATAMILGELSALSLGDDEDDDSAV